MSHHPRKRFGQNFLTDLGVIEHIVDVIAPTRKDDLVEIGPGLGAITLPLLQRASRLQVVELDRDLVPKLQQRCQGMGELTVHQADVLKFDFATIAGPEAALRVVGNLPYNISTPILFHLLSRRELLRDLHFMLQREVVQRMAATPGSASYGRLSVMLQYGCRVEPLFDIEPEAFRPRPKVHSTLVRLVPHTELPHPALDEAMLESVVRQAFSQRRKTLRNTLRSLIEPPQLESLGIDPAARPQTLTLPSFVTLANHLSRQHREGIG